MGIGKIKLQEKCRKTLNDDIKVGASFQIKFLVLLYPGSHLLEVYSSLLAMYLQVYRGYVDDPRNTDNAWMETIAINFHDSEGSSVAKFNFKAGMDPYMDALIRTRFLLNGFLHHLLERY